MAEVVLVQTLLGITFPSVSNDKDLALCMSSLIGKVAISDYLKGK
jgi:hypothetical protein